MNYTIGPSRLVAGFRPAYWEGQFVRKAPDSLESGAFFVPKSNRRGDSRIARRPNGAVKIPSPGGSVAPKGSGEECGRKAESWHNITDLNRCRKEGEAPVEVLAYPKQSHDRPHSSSVRKTVLWDRFSDSFSPGEAILTRPTGTPGTAFPTWHGWTKNSALLGGVSF